MVLAFKQKAISVASSSISLMTSSISTFVNNTLNSIIKVKDSDQRVYLAIDNEVVMIFIYKSIMLSVDEFTLSSTVRSSGLSGIMCKIYVSMLHLRINYLPN